MKERIQIAEGASVRVITRQALPSLRRFITAVNKGVEQHRRLTEPVRAAVAAHPTVAPYFQLEGDLEETFGLRPEYLFPPVPTLESATFFAPDGEVLVADLEEGGPELRQMLTAIGAGGWSVDEMAARVPPDARELFDELVATGFVRAKAVGSPLPAHSPGVYRLQHAGLLFRSQTTGILADPHLHSSFEAPYPQDLVRASLEGLVDAIVISHTHNDHFSLSTLMLFPPEIPIIVPCVPKQSVIADDLVAILRSAGFTDVRPRAWSSEPLTIGDIELHALPFYGEQVLLDEVPRDPLLRNWGNTYLLRTPDYTAWFLIDSGRDIWGSMQQVAEQVRSSFGPVDLLLSNLRSFSLGTPLYINGGGNWLCLTPDQMRRFPQMRHNLITLGAEGVAEVCRACEAKAFLPYAHWWSPPGTVGDGEPPLVASLQSCLEQLGCSTPIVPWRIADGYLRGPSEKAFSVQAFRG